MKQALFDLVQYTSATDSHWIVESGRVKVKLQDRASQHAASLLVLGLIGLMVMVLSGQPLGWISDLWHKMNANLMAGPNAANMVAGSSSPSSTTEPSAGLAVLFYVSAVIFIWTSAIFFGQNGKRPLSDTAQWIASAALFFLVLLEVYDNSVSRLIS